MARGYCDSPVTCVSAPAVVAANSATGGSNASSVSFRAVHPAPQPAGAQAACAAQGRGGFAAVSTAAARDYPAVPAAGAQVFCGCPAPGASGYVVGFFAGGTVVEHLRYVETCCFPWSGSSPSAILGSLMDKGVAFRPSQGTQYTKGQVVTNEVCCKNYSCIMAHSRSVGAALGDAE